MGSGEFRFGRLRQLGRVRHCLLGGGIAVVSAAAFATLPGGAPAGSSGSASPGGGLVDSAFAAIYAENGEDGISPGSRMSNLRLVSLSMPVTGDDTASAGDEERTAAPEPAARPLARPAADRAPFDERFNSIYEARAASFDERFAVAAEGGGETAPRSDQHPDWLASAKVQVELPDHENARLAMRRLVAEVLAETQTAPAETSASASANTSAGTAPNKSPMRLAYAPSDVNPTDVMRSDGLPTDRGNRTAIYDISARVLYMPNGDRLEAHSGYGEHLDDLRSVAIRNLGVTPPTVYKLTMRESLFHGVRAVRLTPLAPGKTYGRDGFLVHPYMLGPNGQSNGCVSVEDYPKFLRAFLNGDVDRMVVVERLTNPPPAEPGSNWLVERIKAFFQSS
jgi:hypothetical protein